MFNASRLTIARQRVGLTKKELAQRVGEGAVDAVIFVFVRDGERQHFLLAQFGKAFHGLSLVLSVGAVAAGRIGPC